MPSPYSCFADRVVFCKLAALPMEAVLLQSMQAQDVAQEESAVSSLQERKAEKKFRP